MSDRLLGGGIDPSAYCDEVFIPLSSHLCDSKRRDVTWDFVRRAL
jgi:hypothetical protein